MTTTRPLERAIAENQGQSNDAAREIAAHSRTLRNSIISLAIFCVLVAALLLAVPGLRSAADHISDANPPWVAVAIGLEALSCLGYVVLFALVFDMLDRHVSWRLSLSELAANSVISSSGLAGLALGAWVLRSRGVSAERIVERSVVLFVLTSAVNVAAVALIGLGMAIGLLPGSSNLSLTLLPAVAATVAIVATLLLAEWTRRATARPSGATARPSSRSSRIAVAMRPVGLGVADTLRVLREHDWRLSGAVGYWLFDNLALYACLAAFGHPPSVWVVFMAYLVGMLANAIPIPGGLVAVEGGLVGMLLLFGVRPASQVLAAVLIYRAISLWLPALIGSLAFLSLRREIGKPLPAGATG
jgi:uncharacterized protein (TIRG00374 family)